MLGGGLARSWHGEGVKNDQKMVIFRVFFGGVYWQILLGPGVQVSTIALLPQGLHDRKSQGLEKYVKNDLKKYLKND